MALIQCPECGAEKISSNANACPQCGFSLLTMSREEKEAREMQAIQRDREKEVKENKERIGCLTLIAVVLLLMICIWSAAVSNTHSTSSKSRTGYCDVCGRKATTYWGTNEVCDKCFYGILNTKVD